MKKKIKTLTIQVPEPCNENWNKMTPTHGGRYCESCEKTIVDFRNYSENEITRYYQRHKGKICGIFRETQLNKPMILPKEPSKSYQWKAAAAILSGLAFGQVGNTQQIIEIPESTVQIIQDSEDKKLKSVNELITIKGQIIDESGEKLIFANIHIKGTSHGTSTDLEGNYQLKIDGKLKFFTLVISYLGYESIEKEIELVNIEALNPNFVMKTSSNSLETAVVIGYGVPLIKGELRGCGGWISSNKVIETESIMEIKEKVEEKLKKPAITIFPNPFTDYFKVAFESPIHDAYLFSIYNQNGQLILAETRELDRGKQSIELQPNNAYLSEGIYVLVVSNSKKFSKTTQIIKGNL